MNKTITRLFTALAFAGLAFTGLEGLEPNRAETVKADDATCVGTVSIREARLADAFGGGNVNCFFALWLKGSDYPDTDGTAAVQSSTVFNTIGASDNFSKMTIGGVTCDQTYVDAYMNMWTYHPVFAFCLFNSRSVATEGASITIASSFRIPTAEAMAGTASTYYTLDKDYTFTPADGYTIPAPASEGGTGGWSDPLDMPGQNIGDATILENTAYCDYIPGSSSQFELIIQADGVDYEEKATANQAFAGEAKDDALTKVKVNGQPLSSYGVTGLTISTWTSPVKNYFGCTLNVTSGFTANTVEVLKGMLLPSANGGDYFTVAHHYVKVHGAGYESPLYVFRDVDAIDDFVNNYLNNESASYSSVKNAFNAMSTLNRQTLLDVSDVYGTASAELTALVSSNGEQIENYTIGSNPYVGDVSVAGIQSYNAFGADNANEFLAIKLEGSDYPDEDGTSPVKFSANQIDYISYVANFITLYDANGNEISTSVFDGYINMWTYHPYFVVGLMGLSNAVKVTVREGMEIPSYAMISEDTASATYGHYLTSETVTYYISENAVHEANSVMNWELPVCNISYLTESGDVIESYAGESIGCGEEYTLRGVPQKDGYSGSWTVVEPEGLTIENLHIVAPEKPCTIVLKATYTARSYTLSFEGIDNTCTVTYGQPVGQLPEVPAKEGFANGRWAVEGVELSADYVWDFAEDKTAVAVYDVAAFTVTFDTDGGSAIDPVTVSYKETVSRPADPTKEGYLFAGWYLGNDLYDFSSEVTSDITLRAKWAEAVTITFDTDGGTTLESVTIAKGEKLERPEFDPTKTGYTFAGWYLNGSEYNFDSPVNENITLTAHWDKIAEKKGCSGSILATSGILCGLAALGAALVILKKKETD